MAATAKSLESNLSVCQAADEPAESRRHNELFRFRFGVKASGDVGGNIFRLHIDSIGSPAPDEIWFTNSAVSYGEAGAFAIAECDDYLVAHIEIELGENVDFQNLTTQIYRDLLQVLQERGYANLIRVWNFFPGINAGDGDLELYRQFTAGRAVVFDEFAYQGETLPAGTAIGTDQGTPFTITALATRDKCRMVENPRQTSAYEYPREYGLRSPSFSRAVVVETISGYRILISGTASIVGYQSMYLDNPVQQATETLRNLGELIEQARCETQTQQSSGRPLTNGYLRIYVRRSGQVAQIKQVLHDYLVNYPAIVFLRGDICRRELLLEIEAAGDI